MRQLLMYNALFTVRHEYLFNKKKGPNKKEGYQDKVRSIHLVHEHHIKYNSFY